MALGKLIEDDLIPFHGRPDELPSGWNGWTGRARAGFFKDIQAKEQISVNSVNIRIKYL
jgi:hypothetical protein